MKKLLTVILFALFLFSASTAIAGLSISLEWTPNSESDVAGYNVYRSEIDGGPYTFIGASGIDPCQYTDAIVAYDTNYYWVVTAFDNEVPRNESGYSNQVSFFRETPPDVGSPGTPQNVNITIRILTE